MEEKTAIQFYKDIQKEEEKYKLVNGLFIIRYINSEECIYVGEFMKVDRVGNNTKTNKVLLGTSPQIFNPSKKAVKRTDMLGIWKPLNIGWREQDIKEILK